MGITYETLDEFVREHGSVIALDAQHRARMLPSGEADRLDIIEKADRLVFGGTPEPNSKL
jgi:hypothetical protein